ncbi:Aste57867_6931 [Aphanomyces stellatus]|uniref:Aste57867_6931 protein n=1 Tax=Aphanomyces stellatus TaxID=120398 RepID=A0A485KHF8_9STRA|nr:hypothetical protein As57867_006909 [Aphanomyces stellatus]VFT83883.1 Aste57867_6931 [Aphanomyces stellatus]
MRLILSTLACVVTLLAAAEAPPDPNAVLTFRKCRHTNYVTEGNQIFAVDPANPATKSKVVLKGVQWLGTESSDAIPLGLWGKGSVQIDSGINGTSLADMLKFLYTNEFNAVRIPLSADNVIQDITPKITNIHGENKEIALYDKGFVPKMSDFIARFIGSFQKYRIGVVLDIHTLTVNFAQDAYWYYPLPTTSVETTAAYQAAVILATNYCKPEYWNVLGIDLKNAMTDAQWASSSSTANSKVDWAAAADAIATKINQLCPQWLVFVTGASKGSFTANNASYPLWPGMNFANATARPLRAKNIVYSPQAFTQAQQPLGYFFNPASNCSTAILADRNTQCAVVVNDTLMANKYRSLACENSKFQCQSYKPLSTATLTATYQRLLDENVGGVVKAAAVPTVFGSFSGIYGKTVQPLQSAVLDLLIQYIATSTSGGFFASLNPDTEMWLESPPAGNTTVGKAHYGLMMSNSWQVPNADLLAALAGLKSSGDLPCYGDAAPGKLGAPSGAGAVSLAATALAMALVLL